MKKMYTVSTKITITKGRKTTGYDGPTFSTDNIILKNLIKEVYNSLIDFKPKREDNKIILKRDNIKIIFTLNNFKQEDKYYTYDISVPEIYEDVKKSILKKLITINPEYKKYIKIPSQK